MRKFEIGDAVIVRKGLFEGAYGTIMSVVPSSEYPGQYKFRVDLSDSLKGESLEFYEKHEKLHYFYSWEIMFLVTKEDKNMNFRFNCGDGVRVISGPYSGMTGLIVDRAVEKGLYKIISMGTYWWVKESEVELQDSYEKVNDLHKAFRNGINSVYGFTEYGKCYKPRITDVIFNAPATIVFWTDGTKTVVKAVDGETYDREKGLAMAISKKYFGNEGNYYNEFKKWLPEEDNKELTVGDILRAAIDELNHESDEAAK